MSLPLFLGIDQSVRHTGVCLLSLAPTGLEVLRWELIEPKLPAGGSRLVFIRDHLATYFQDPVTCAVMEGYSYNSHSRHFDLGEVGGLVKLACTDANTPLYEAAPKQLKKFVTGRGSADKALMMKCVKAKWGASTGDDNLADAYGLARIAYALSLQDTELPIRSELEVVKAIKSKGLLTKKKRSKVKGLAGAL